MTNQEKRNAIRERHIDLLRRLNENSREREHIRLDFEHLHLECGHPDAYPYSAMGDVGRKCPDCGWAT